MGRQEKGGADLLVQCPDLKSELMCQGSLEDKHRQVVGEGEEADIPCDSKETLWT